MKRVYGVLGNISCDFNPKVKVKGQILYVLASPKPFYFLLQTLQVHSSHDIEGPGQHLM